MRSAITDSPQLDTEAEAMLRVTHRENDYFTREQVTDRHGSYVRWECSHEKHNIRLEVVANANGLYVTGRCKGAPPDFGPAMAEILRLAGPVSDQLAAGVAVASLKFQPA